MSKTKGTKALSLLLILASLFFASRFAYSEPEGAQVTNISVTTKNATIPDSRTDPKGTITTVNLQTIQQNIHWKAYVGNVSGTLVLQDAEAYSIYQWSIGGSPTGEVYITRNNSIDWSTIQCANNTQIATEDNFLGFTNASSDNINNTFATRTHKQFDIGFVPINQSSCKAAYPYVNSSAQVVHENNTLFQEVLLMDFSSKIVFASMINQDTDSYKNNLTKFDFQAIVPDFTGAQIATYYFYVEISS